MSEMTAKELSKEMDDAVYYGRHGKYLELKKQFCDQLCREQRNECYEILLQIPTCWRNDMDFIKSELLNAKSPDL